MTYAGQQWSIINLRCAEWHAKRREGASKMSNTIHDRAIHSEPRELCLALAKVCESLHQWEGGRTLRRAAEYLYHEKYREMFKAAADEAHAKAQPLMARRPT